MNLLLLVSLFFGLFMIVVRGPLVFAPEAVTEFYRKELFEKPNRLRAMGAFFGILGCTMIITANGVAGIGAWIIFVFGFILIPAALLVVFAPGPVKRLVTGVLDFFGPMGLRVLGMINIVAGLVWIYLSFRWFG